MLSKQKGLGLVELMVSILIGMIIMSGLVAIASATFGANAAQMRMAQLNFELRSVVDTLSRDLRRASYAGTQGAPATTTQGAITLANAGGSVAFTYRENDADAALRTYTYSLQTTNGVGTVNLQIDAGGAQSLTDTGVVNVSTFLVENIDTINVESCGEFSVTSPVYRITVVGNLQADANAVRRVVEIVRPRNNQVAVAAACPP